ncbi:uncharacterized protein LOC141665695 [Apium graveolens]|uniref:uncharacterized protein LOC141665695 n=1 Tax=Apium graveolens TaxID=4045 RepID=UPI003D7C0EED
MYVYLSVTDHAVSGVLVKENEGVQSSVYYVSKSLVDAETRYTSLEKLVLALAMTSIKLRHYYESHKIHVMTNFPLRNVLSKHHLTGQMEKWAIRISTYDIMYDTITVIKSQALADFVADISPIQMTDAEQEFQQVLSRVDAKPWTWYTDGASNINGMEFGLVLKSPQGDMIAQTVCCDFKPMNNEAEYEAWIMGLTIAKDMKIKNIDVNYDSLLVVNHVKGSYEAKDPKMVAYLDITKGLTNHFDNFSIQQVPRENNVQADALAGLGAVFKNLDLNNIPVVHIVKPAMERLVFGSEIMALDQRDDDTSEDADNWIKTYKDYLQFGTIPANNNEAMVLRMKPSRFTIIDGELFKKSSTGLLQRCLKKHEADMVLRDEHEGECRNHTNGRNLSLKILRLGYYRTILRQDALDYAKNVTSVNDMHLSYINHLSIFTCPFHLGLS